MGAKLTSEEVCKMLRVKKTNLAARVARNEIPHYRVSARHVIFDEAEIREWLNSRRVQVRNSNANAIPCNMDRAVASAGNRPSAARQGSAQVSDNGVRRDRIADLSGPGPFGGE